VRLVSDAPLGRHEGDVAAIHGAMTIHNNPRYFIPVLVRYYFLLKVRFNLRSKKANQVIRLVLPCMRSLTNHSY